MSATIFQHELRTKLRSVITWSVSVAVLLFVFLSLFPGFSQQAAVVQQMMSRFPPALLEAFGLGKMDLTSLLGFYSFLFIFIQLCMAIQASNYGFGLVSIEESELTADFLLSKPVSRGQVLTSKLLAALTSLIITDLVITLFTFIAIAAFASGKAYDLRTLILLLVSILIFQVFFLGVGLIISLLVKRVRSVTPFSLGLGFGAYVLAAFSGVFGDVKIEYITPFKHFDPAYIVSNNAYNVPLVVLNVAVSVIALAVSYWLYIRRDIHAVS